jgi:cytochrome c biogenesis protein CcdA
VDQSDATPVDRTGYRSRLFALAMTLVGMSVAGLTAWLRTPREGLIVALGIALVVGLFLVLRQPPPSRPGNRDPAGMNFGRKR